MVIPATSLPRWYGVNPSVETVSSVAAFVEELEALE